MIQVTHNGHDLYIGQRITVLSTLRLLRAGGIDPDYIRRVMAPDRPPTDAELLTVDEAIEVMQ